MNKINILFAGDFAPCRGFEPLIVQRQEAIMGEALGYIKSADISFVNLECPLTKGGQSIKKSGPSLRSSASTASILAKAGFTLVGLANNHVFDYGQKGLQDTLNAFDSLGIPVVGAGMDLSVAQQPFITEEKGVKVAIIAIAEHEFNQSEKNRAGSAPIDPIYNFQQIKQAQAKADIVIVTLHGGNEYFPYPRPGLRKLCRFYIDLGVNAVICHHPHVPGAYEYYQNKPIVYSLGNFIFDVVNPPKEWEFGYMASLLFDSGNKTLLKLELIPYQQSTALGGIRLLQGEEKTAFLTKIDKMKSILEDDTAWLNEWQKFVNKQADSYLLRQYSPVFFRGLGFLSRYTSLTKLFFNKNNGLDKLNMIRCQSHRELLLAVLKLKG